MFDVEKERGHDSIQIEFSDFLALRRHLRIMSLRFADILAEAKADQSSAIAVYGHEYLGFGYVVDLENSFGSQPSIGISAAHWAFPMGLLANPQVPCDGKGDACVVFYFEEWTEFHASQTYKPETGFQMLENWVLHDSFAPNPEE